MRITNGMMVSRMMANMNSNLRSMDRLNNDLASGVRIHRPSDDPVLVGRSLKIHTDIAQTEQFTRNVDDAYSFLDKTETSLKELTNVMHRVRELAAQASNGVLTKEDSQKIESEIKQLKDHMTKIGNDTYVGRHIFSGFSTDKPFLNEQGSIASEFIDDSTGEIKTEGQEIEYHVGVSGKTSVNITGDQIFGPVETDRVKLEPDAGGDYYWKESVTLMGSYTMQVPQLDSEGHRVDDTGNRIKIDADGNVLDHATGDPVTDGAGDPIKVDSDGNRLDAAGEVMTDAGGKPIKPFAKKIQVQGTMDKLIAAMEKGDSEAMSDLLQDIDVHMDNISKLRGDVGARMNTVEVIKERADTMNLNFAKLLSETEDTDMGEAVMNLSMREAVYKASLSTGARIIQPTLIDFLR